MPSLDDILAIPGNAPVYQRLRGMLDARQAIAFAGAGVSTPLYPLWPELLKSLAHAPVEKGLATPADEEYWLRTAGKRPLQVASQIHQKLGDAHYYPFLYETFKDRPPYVTPAHDALIRCNFKAWITTNYDQGLVEARRTRRPEIRETGYAIWNQTAEIERWLSGDRFGPDSCPILFAHGHFADAANIVLDHESYRRAYAIPTYRRFYEDLWIREHLIFAGFSFNDVTLTAIADEMVSKFTYTGPPRHVAILALNEPYNDGMRREYLETFHADVLFYPVPANDHSALVVLMESLARPAKVPVAPPPAPAAKVRQRFVHETTEDEKFTGRRDMLERLDAWAAEPSVRLVAISALGGLGKTALLGKWLRSGAHQRQGVFFWSFYRDRDTPRMVEALKEFAQSSESVAIGLDGLEVIQESPSTTGYGKLLDPILAEALHQHCRARDGNLVLLTSRFPFPDLTPYLGRGLRSLPLASLADKEGAALLEALGVGGRVDDRAQVSRQLDGHPLALRIFARSMPPECGGDPTRLWARIFGDGDHTLEEKVRHLLEFYEQRLPAAHRQVLGLLALFRAPVGVKTLAPLWEKLIRAPAPLGRTLDFLHREHLLTDDPGPEGESRYACHPILRDHFRRRMMGTEGFAREAASLLGEAPDAAKTRSLETIMPVITAIELLLECRDLQAADDLYRSRLENGKVFRWIPAPHWGMEVARWFVRDEERRQRLEAKVGARRLSFYLHAVGLYAGIAGEPETAVPHYAASEALDRQAHDSRNLSIDLQNRADVETSLGRLGDAVRHTTEALEAAVAAQDDHRTRNGYARLAFAAGLRGDLDTAAKAFAEANLIENRINPEGDNLFSSRGIQWAEHLLRTGQTSHARKLTTRNREICEGNSWQQTVASCEWMLGWLDVVGGNWSSAHRRLDQAEATFTRGHMVEELARVHLVRSACHLAEDHLERALATCERALDLAAPRNYRLIHADGMVLRAQISLARGDAATARNDAESALQIAEPCEYPWAQRDACEVLAQAWRILGNLDETARYTERAANLNRRLTPAPE
ncbi:MAG TPA: SIR2 family protein [Bryobacteraceae bacterium]|nr:SIR2 family protein [Bryobacteraceae bacterium]